MDARPRGDVVPLDPQNSVPAGADRCSRISRHSLAVLPTVEPRPTLDGELLADAQRSSTAVPLAKRAYEALVRARKSRPAALELTEHAGPECRLDPGPALGPAAQPPMPGVFTYDGFHEVFLRAAREQAQRRSARELGPGRPGARADRAQIARLKADMLRLYYDDAIAPGTACCATSRWRRWAPRQGGRRDQGALRPELAAEAPDPVDRRTRPA